MRLARNGDVDDPGAYIIGDTKTRFWSKVDASGICWEWTGRTNSEGYGHFRLEGTPGPIAMAHRFAWESLVGPITEETLDHLCLNKRCVNPDHLEPVSRAENTRRKWLARVA
jgi:hypothetical protein